MILPMRVMPETIAEEHSQRGDIDQIEDSTSKRLLEDEQRREPLTFDKPVADTDQQGSKRTLNLRANTNIHDLPSRNQRFENNIDELNSDQVAKLFEGRSLL